MNPPASVRTVAAGDLLVQAHDAMDSRAQLRDQPNGERSMARCIAAFNAIHGTALTEVQGWHFMVLLKLARAIAGRKHLDDYVDLTAYGALAGEAAHTDVVHPLKEESHP